MSKVDRRPVVVLLGLFLIGVAGGLVQLASDMDKTSTGAGVATANWVHIGLAVALVAALVAGYRRDPRALAAFLVRPVTYQGWGALRDGLVGVPMLVQQRGPAPARRVAVGLPLAVLAFLASVTFLYAPLRAGEQVFAAVDPDFTRDAWGGPSYLGASLAHWLDAVYLFYASSAVLSLAAARRHGALVDRGTPAHRPAAAGRPTWWSRRRGGYGGDSGTGS